MKMERLSQDKIRIFLTFDDLTERGIHKEDMWREIPKVHELFSEMMDQAYMELGFDATGPLAVEVLAMPAQGMMVIVTRGKMNFSHTEDTMDEDLEEVYELEVTLDETDQVTYAFHDFEDLLRLAKVINPLLTDGGTLYSYKNKWILLIDAADMEDKQLQLIVAVLSEYGDATSVTQAMLEEYGKTVIESDAVKVLCAKF
ncbi:MULTISPECIES: genetic competence negative regulator [unclassified Paenibacillus]|uniref:genetic competence negative regulator n=1 Tax=unclassified Paenibacillus TaxID=185978 RepID=UPI001AE7FAE6|nr:MULTISPECIES: genetic competence negative regulator [unclassified Paenibacillus]MBP1155231.1 adapter protein MecA 1/2 [Paenibacillus sp. PvP091]MBP1169385.1 adapter protein MecA 1/2 [Paenibacillus sp. PvR098]MBP2440413.1 adapter protein MecA 1/2 [Paenibacillus sp. PvP052]